MNRRGGASAAVLVAASLLLVSCAAAPTVTPPPAPTATQVNRMMQGWAAQQSSLHSGHILGSQQSVSFVRFLPPTTREAALWPCLQHFDPDVFVPATDRKSSPSSARLAVAQRDYAIAVCNIEYPPSSIEDQLRTPRQLDYTYAYYANQLVPCLRSFGIGVHAMPTAAEFGRDAGNGLTAWSPYAALDVAHPPAPPRSVLESACPPAPPGISG